MYEPRNHKVIEEIMFNNEKNKNPIFKLHKQMKSFPKRKQMNMMNINNNINNMGLFNNNNDMNNEIKRNNYMENIFNNNDSFIKNLIQPYEEKIKELEEKLSKKEYEIACLKVMLNQNNFNPMNYMNHMDNMNQVNQLSEKQISLNFNYNECYETVKVLYDELMISVFYRYCKKKGIDPEDYKFFFNQKKLLDKLTVSECGLNNNSNITVIKIINDNIFENNEIKFQNNIRRVNHGKNKFINLIFKNITGLKINIICNIKDTVGNAIKKYLRRMNLDEDLVTNQEIFFLFDTKKMLLDDNTKIGKFFRNLESAIIIVHDTMNLIGN